MFGDEVGMDAGDQQEPRDQRHVLHGIPCPVPAEGEGFVRPGRTHQDTYPQDGGTEKRPGQCRAQPRCVLALPQPGHGKAEGNGRAGESQEKGGGMDGHPIVLEKGIQPLSGELLEIVGIVEQGDVRGLPQQHEGIESQLQGFVFRP